MGALRNYTVRLSFCRGGCAEAREVLVVAAAGDCGRFASRAWVSAGV